MKHRLGVVSGFIRNRAGNVAILTGLCALPLIGIMGLAIDYSLALLTKSRLDAAADAAAIAAITKAQSVILANGGQDGDYQAEGAAQGQAAFKANLGAMSFAEAPTPTVSVLRSGQNITANVSYATSNQTQFGSIFGVKTGSVSGRISSVLSMKKYVNIYLLVDTSNSMGIGASTQDMTALYNKTGCVFGCHVPAGGAQTNEVVAHQNNIKLRIDVVKSAISNMLLQAQATAGSTPTVGIGIYTLEMKLNTLSVPTQSYSTLAQINDNIDLGTNDNPGHSADTYTQNVVADFTNIIPANGDGTSSMSPLNYVFVLTDGTYDVGCSSGSCVGPYNPSWFASLKAKSTVGVIYTTYYPFYNNNNPNNGLDYFYVTNISPIESQLVPNLKSCASDPQWFIQASDGPSINNALQNLFAQATGSARLSQ